MKKLIVLTFLLVCCISLFAQWKYKHYVDRFGDKTDDTYIFFSDANGNFSNSATNGSRLTAECILSFSPSDSLPTIRFDLYEYSGSVSVGKAIGGADYTLSIKLADDTKEEYTLEADDVLYLKDSDNDQKKAFINHLIKESKPIKCIIVVAGEYSTQTYRFKINPVGFSSAFSKIKAQQNS